MSEGFAMHPEGYEQVWAELPTLLFISLSKGKFTVIDGCDWPIVAGVPLYAGGKPGSWYATASSAGMQVQIHRLLLPGLKMIDHRNRDGLDNRRCNLRAATSAQNQANRRGWGRCGFKGTYLNRGKYVAAIAPHGRTRNLGTFGTVEEAAEAYDIAAVEDFGEFAYLNFPERRGEYLKILAGRSHQRSSELLCLASA
jgi:hypothetical protein